MDYRTIIQQISLNLGVDNPSTREIDVVKRDVYAVLMFLMRKSAPIQKTHNVASLTTSDESTFLPSDFYLADQVIIYASSGNRYFSKELEHEEYLRWQPNPELTVESFNELVTDATPQEIFYTKENFDYDGYVGWTIPDEMVDNSGTLVYQMIWKPTFTGSMDVLYKSIDGIGLSDVALTITPEIRRAFHDTLVSGGTTKALQRKIMHAKSEIELASMQLSYRLYKDDYDNGVAELAGVTNASSETPRIEPFEYLNDWDMMIL